MEMQIRKIFNSGDIRSEYIELRANISVNLKNFIASNTCYYHCANTELKNIYWFPELSVESGTVIRLNTRKGINKHLGILDLYWNLDHSLWKDKSAKIYIIKLDHYITYPEISNDIDALFSCD